MKLTLTIILVLSMLSATSGSPQKTSSAERAWKPFFASFRAAVKKRDREAIMSMMSREFYYLSSGGDENDNNDTRDEAFEYWNTTQIGAWEALEGVLNKGTVTNTAMREPGSSNPSRIAPPIANNRRAINSRSFPWYAIFEFKDGRWYWTAFTECCD